MRCPAGNGSRSTRVAPILSRPQPQLQQKPFAVTGPPDSRQPGLRPDRPAIPPDRDARVRPWPGLVVVAQRNVPWRRPGEKDRISAVTVPADGPLGLVDESETADLGPLPLVVHARVASEMSVAVILPMAYVYEEAALADVQVVMAALKKGRALRGGCPVFHRFDLCPADHGLEGGHAHEAMPRRAAAVEGCSQGRGWPVSCGASAVGPPMATTATATATCGFAVLPQGCLTAAPHSSSMDE